MRYKYGLSFENYFFQVVWINYFSLSFLFIIAYVFIPSCFRAFVSQFIYLIRFPPLQTFLISSECSNRYCYPLKLSIKITKYIYIQIQQLQQAVGQNSDNKRDQEKFRPLTFQNFKYFPHFFSFDIPQGYIPLMYRLNQPETTFISNFLVGKRSYSKLAKY